MKLYPTSHYDDKSNNYNHISTEPLAAAIGAEVKNVDLSNISDEQFAEISAALYRYKMIFFRDQDISHDDQEKLTLRFGTFGKDAYTSGVEGHPDIQHVLKAADTVVSMIFGGNWHTDSPFLQRPPSVSLLHGVDIPPYGGDTWWSNTELAYDYLSDTMKEMIAPLKVHMSAAGVMASLRKTNKDGSFRIGPMELEFDEQAIVNGHFHPLVRTHPVTGKKALYVDKVYSLGIQGMTEEEATPLLKFLAEHASRPEFNCRLHWQKNTFVIWDNRACIHYAFNDYDGYRREMFRTIVEGEIPE